MPVRDSGDLYPDGRALLGEACATLTVDLDAIAANWRTCRELGGASECGAVVKGNAYGTGIEPAVRVLWSAGARTFFAATIEEARRVRGTLPPEATVYVLNGLLPGTSDAFIACDLRPVLGSAEEIAEWRALGGTGEPLPAALHVDTGMNRLGIRVDEARALAGDPGFPVALVMTHMACADEPDHPLNASQIAGFESVRAAFAGVPASLANSASVMYLGCAGDYDISRPGIALYGGEAVPGHDNPMRPVVRLDAPALLVRDVPAGETVGYGATWTATRDSRIAVVGLGYADGFHRVASVTGVTSVTGSARPYRVMIGDDHAPLAGRVNMDLLTIDVTDLPRDKVARGTGITVIGGGIPLGDTAAQFGTNVYEVLTSLGARYARRYTGTQ